MDERPWWRDAPSSDGGKEKQTEGLRQLVMMGRRGLMSGELVSGKMIHKVARQQPSCRILICNRIKWPLSGTFLFPWRAQEKVVVSSARNWGPAWQVLKQKRGRI